MGAVAGIDYEEAKGTVEMPEGVMSFPIPITIKASFNVVLSDPKCTGSEAAKGKVGFAKDTDGGEDSCICHVEIKGKSSATRDHLLSRMASKLQGSKVAHEAWAAQVKDALFKVVDDDDEDGDGEGGGDGDGLCLARCWAALEVAFLLGPPHGLLRRLFDILLRACLHRARHDHRRRSREFAGMFIGPPLRNNCYHVRSSRNVFAR